MGLAHWRVSIDGIEHTVDLDHNVWSCRRRIWIDGDLRLDSDPPSSFPMTYRFNIGSTTIKVCLCRHLWAGPFYYLLEVDGNRLESMPPDRLLIPSTAPGEQGELLRPAAGVSNASEGNLLRPARSGRRRKNRKRR